MAISAYKYRFEITYLKYTSYKWTQSNIVHLGTPYISDP